MTAIQPASGTVPDPQSIAERFIAARAAGRAIDWYPGVVPPDLATAYRVQAAVLANWPDALRGWKVARVAPAFARQYPEERLIGPVFARNVRWTSSNAVASCAVFEGGFAAVESEIVIVVANDTPPHKRDWNADSVVELIRSIHIGVEVASSPLATLNDLGPGAVISDFGNNWGVVVGPEIPNWRAVDSIDVETFVDDVSVGIGRVSMRTGPLGALAFTLNKRAEQGATLRAGDVISTGMITGVHDVRAGQRSRHLFVGCGEVNVQLTRALPTERS